MANYNKSFNFRNGVQVDNDNFIVNSNGLVGIGTSIPTEFLDVHGNAKITGLVTATSIFTPNLSVNQNLNVSGIATIGTLKVGVTSITSGIITASSGIVTYYGDGGYLLNLPTSQWLDIDVGLGFTSIYNKGYVGIATNDPRFSLQIGGNPNVGSGVGISSVGNIKLSGIITASSFSGSGSSITSLNADNISSGTVSNSRLPSNINVSGIITATSGFYGNLTGNVTGIASTANSISSTANITVNSINSGFSTTGISTIFTKLNVVNGSIGVGTLTPNSDIQIRRSGVTSVQLTSDGSYSSRITFGRTASRTGNNAELLFGNTNLSFSDSTEKSLDIINYDTGNINNYLSLGSPGIGTGNFNWIYGQTLTKLMTLTYQGNLGINQSSPTNTLHVVGTSTVTSDSYVGGKLSVSGNSTFNSNLTVNGSITAVNQAFFNNSIGIATNSISSYSLQIGSNPITSSGVGISSTGNIFLSGGIKATGIVTASGFASNGPAVYINVTGNQLTFTVNGVGSTTLTLS